MKINGRNLMCLLCAGIVVASVNGEESTKPFSLEKKQSIHQSMNEFVFKLNCYEEEDGMCYTKTITVADPKADKQIQVIKTSDFNEGDDAQAISREAVELVFDDLNFDGFMDMRIQSYVTAGANRTAICWLWNEGKRQFVYDKALSELVNLEIDAKNNQLRAGSRVDAATYREEAYKYIDGKLTLVEAEEERFKENGKTSELITWRLKDGKLTEIGRKTLIPGEDKDSPRANMLAAMPTKDWKALNVFFSNFSETGLENFDANKKNDKALACFAVQHNVINNRSLFKDDEDSGNSYLDEKNVNSTIKKYFGIDKINPKETFTDADFVSYSKGKFFWLDVFEGAPTFTGSQVIELYDNGDGTFSAVVEEYSDNDKYQDDPENFTPAFYAPKKDWEKTTSSRCKLSGYHAAKIGTQTYNGKKVYKLLKWQPADSLKKARNLAKKTGSK